MKVKRNILSWSASAGPLPFLLSALAALLLVAALLVPSGSENSSGVNGKKIESIARASE